MPVNLKHRSHIITDGRDRAGAAGTGNNPAKGALVGAGVGGAAGAIYDITR